MAPAVPVWLLDALPIPAIWRQAKSPPFLKPKNVAENPKKYRPISLVCIHDLQTDGADYPLRTCINDIVEDHLSHAQAGFRKGRTTTDQICRPVHDIEMSFQSKETFGVIFLDHTAAYDTVWHRDLYLKLLKLLPDVKLVIFIILLI